ncbi:MAG TPA: transposase family protein [Micromonosporaceae bacterium]|jgi:hypothetical protein
MDDSTSLLFGLDSLRVVDVVRVADRVVQVVIETVERQGICPECGVASTRVKGRTLMRVHDLPVADQRVALWWRKRRLVCLEPACPRRSFTPSTVEIPARSRLTARLRQRLAEAVAGSNRAVSEVAAEYGLSWWCGPVHRAFLAASARWLPPPAPVRVLGIDETRARTVRWVLEDVGCRHSDPWMTSFVDADTTGPRAGVAGWVCDCGVPWTACAVWAGAQVSR